MIYTFKNAVPVVHPTAYIADGAKVIGDVHIGENSSVWFNAVLRGDLEPIRIGSGTNIQDGAIGHTSQNFPLIVGNGVTVGHAAIIHGCTIGDGALIGMGALVLDGAEIGEYALIGAGTLVTENTKIPPYTLVLGRPGKVVRELTENDLQRMTGGAGRYREKALEYAPESGLVRKVER